MSDDLRFELARLDPKPYQYGQAYYGVMSTEPEDRGLAWTWTVVFVAVLCIPLDMLEPNRYGCYALPDWGRHFDRSREVSTPGLHLAGLRRAGRAA